MPIHKISPIVSLLSNPTSTALPLSPMNQDSEWQEGFDVKYQKKYYYNKRSTWTRLMILLTFLLLV